MLKLIDKINETVGKVVSFLILLLASIITYDVVLRYGFNRPTVWGQELSTMIFGTYVILGGAYTAIFSGHINMDVIYNRLSEKNKLLMNIVTFFIFTGPFLFVLIWHGGGMAFRSLMKLERSSTLWGPPIFPLKMVLPIGACLFLAQAFVKMIRDLFLLIRLFKRERG